jgi:protein-S-isoprenylcysteine O-methyltransferase Ste14
VISIMLNYIVPGLWLALIALWLLTASRTKTAEQSEQFASRIIHVTLMAVAGVLVLSEWARIGPLGWRFLPDVWLVPAVGCAIEALGIAFAMTARLYLGRNWSGKVTLKADHELIRTGPYRLARHPIYTGILIAFLGSAIAYGVVAGLVGTVVAFAALMRKIPQEETVLAEAFGEEYARYRLHVKALIPYIL